MLMKLASTLLVVVAAFLSATSAFAAACTGSGPRPVWIDSPETVTEQHFFAAGVSDSARVPLSERIATAKQNALKSLSEMIQVSVKNALVLEQTSRKSWGGEFTDSSLSSVTQTSTEASLRNVEIIDTWEDPKTCDMWLRARVSKADVEKGKREGLSKMLFAAMKANVEVAQNDTRTLDQRLAATDAAQDALSRIAFEFIKDAGSSDYYTRLLAGLKASLQRAKEKMQQAQADLRTADLLVAEAGTQTGENERSRRLTKAATLYKTLLANYNAGIPDLFGPGDLLFKLGEVELQRRSPCGARNYFQQVQDSAQLIDRREIARKKSESLACSAEDMEKTLWRQYFEGRPVTLLCYFKAGQDAGNWLKACDGLNNVIRPLGAEVQVVNKPLTAAQLNALTQGELADDLQKDGVLLAVVASGKMASRIDRDPQSRGHDYQFDGAMASLLVENGNIVFSDRFKGTTGWNPISSDMVMDVLAINVVKRWQNKFSKFLNQDLQQ
jgi:hypothetical protein